MPGYLELKSGYSYPTYDLQMAAGIHLCNHGISDRLEFDEKSHVYWADGVIIPSITQIPRLAGMTDFQKGGDAEWYMDRGKALHKASELYDLGLLDPDTIDPEIMGEFTAYVRFREEVPLKMRHIEHRLWSPRYKYAGTLDRVIEGYESYNLYLRKNGTYRLKKAENVPTNFQYFLSALVCVTNHAGAGVEIARLNVENWKRRFIKGGNNG